MEITGGGSVSNYDGEIGYFSGSTGTVTIDGAVPVGPTITPSESENNGNATVHVANGGALSTPHHLRWCLVRRDRHGHARRPPARRGPTRWAFRSATRPPAESTLPAARPWRSVSYGVAIGYTADGTGVITVDGDGSMLILDSDHDSALTVGQHGVGTLNITNGGAVSVAGGTYVAYLDGSSGTIDFGSAGGTLTHAVAPRLAGPT